MDAISEGSFHPLLADGEAWEIFLAMWNFAEILSWKFTQIDRSNLPKSNELWNTRGILFLAWGGTLIVEAPWGKWELGTFRPTRDFLSDLTKHLENHGVGLREGSYPQIGYYVLSQVGDIELPRTRLLFTSGSGAWEMGECWLRLVRRVNPEG